MKDEQALKGYIEHYRNSICIAVTCWKELEKQVDNTCIRMSELMKQAQEQHIILAKLRQLEKEKKWDTLKQSHHE